jgi:Esterase/lipase
MTEGGAGTGEQRLQPPSLFLMLAEARSLFELNSSLLLSPLLLRAPKGDGHPVLTLPGFLASDLSMAPMRRYLKELGYDAYAWNMGRNFGGVASKRGALRDLLTAHS